MLILIDYISDSISPIFFFSRSDVGEVFNKPSHNLNLVDLARYIDTLWAEGLIRFKINNVIIKRQKIEKIVWWLTNEHILRSNIKECPVIMLTDCGGKLWESTFKPNWDMFIDIREEIIEEEAHILGSENTIFASNKERLNELLDSIENEFKSFSLKNKIIEIKPFFPVYWKQLENGFQVNFFMKEKEQLQYDNLIYQSYRSGLIPKSQGSSLSMPHY